MIRSTADRFLEDNEMVVEPPMPFGLRVGDTVRFTNDYGCEFGPVTIIGFCKPEHVLHGRFVHLGDDSPWFPVHPHQVVLWD